MQHDRDQWSLSATCPVCGASRLITAFDAPPYLRLDGAHGPFPPLLTARDVLEWRAFLARFEGDLVALLAGD